MRRRRDSGRVELPGRARSYFFALIALLALGAILPVAASAAPSGSLDRSFGVHGKVVRAVHPEPLGFSYFPNVEWPRVALAPDGKIVVEMEWTLLGYLADGKPDRSFGTNGKVTLGGGAAGKPFLPVDLAIDSRGRVLVAGSSGGIATVYRFTRRGRPDQSFGSGGISSSTIGLPPAFVLNANPPPGTPEESSSPEVYPYGLAVDSRDRPVLTGINLNSVFNGFFPHGPECGSSSAAFVARLTEKGEPDPRFHGQGFAAIQWQGTPAAPIIGPKDSVIYGGHGLRSPTPVDGCEQERGSDAFLEDLSVHGTPTASWPGGWTTLHPTNVFPAYTWFVEHLALGRFGRLFVLEGVEEAGSRSGLLWASVEARHLRSGAPDTSFGRNGAVSELENYPHGYSAIATDSKGRVLLVGVRSAGRAESREGSFQVLRLRRDGRVDTSFGKHGSVTTTFGPGMSASGRQVIVDGHGRILVAGALGEFPSEPTGFAIARYLP